MLYLDWLERNSTQIDAANRKIALQYQTEGNHMSMNNDEMRAKVRSKIMNKIAKISPTSSPVKASIISPIF
jgi:hypothetical protein